MKEREEEEREQVKTWRRPPGCVCALRESGAISWLQLVRGTSQVRVLLSVQQVRQMAWVPRAVHTLFMRNGAQWTCTEWAGRGWMQSKLHESRGITYPVHLCVLRFSNSD